MIPRNIYDLIAEDEQHEDPPRRKTRKRLLSIRR